MIEKRTNKPFINVWFGNFYRPAFDDKEFVAESIKKFRDMGFNGIQLDSKAWEDFHDRFNGGEASEYVAMQEYMMEQCRKNGIGYNFLSLYLCADNLYPNIRFSPPIFGESVTNADGTDGRWYKYWSDKAKASMIEHNEGLFRLYSGGVSRVEINGREVMPTCTMWDPIVAPSFDSEGRECYLKWLAEQYKTIDQFNAMYKTSFHSFEDLQKEDYWFSCAYPDVVVYTKEELECRSPRVIMWADNMKWRIYELCEYFKDMQQRFKRLDPDIYTMPDMAQWSYFLNVDAAQLSDVGLADLWDTSNRGIDIYKLAPYVDCANFITVPITPYGDPDAYVTSVQHAMMRSMNRGREFIGGIYWGRFLYNDIYEYLTPCEIVGTIAASGASGYTAYGLCGLDDGGVLHRMSDGFNRSLKTANDWAASVIPQLGNRCKNELAILFPAAMSAYEPMGVAGNKERRYDFLGWYKMCRDFGFDCDVIDPTMIENGVLSDYRVLIVPENDCYFLDDNSAMEAIVKEWVKNGGVIVHAPYDELVKNCFGISGRAHEKDAFFYLEKGLAQGDSFCTYDGEALVEYLSGGTAVAKCSIGGGTVYSFGFSYGYCYSAKIAPHVPLSQKNNELYPVPILKHNILCDILAAEGIKQCAVYGKGIETAVFEHGVVVVNHTSHPIELDMSGRKCFQYEQDGKTLAARSAAVIFR